MGPFSLRTLLILAIVAIFGALLAYSLALLIVVSIPVGMYGLAAWAKDRGAKVDPFGVLIFSLIGFVFASAVVLPQLVSHGPPPATACLGNLRQIGLALAEYQVVYHCYPPPFVADAQGRPLVSWRVLLLPYLNQQALYDQWKQHRDEPWDGPHNRKISQQTLEYFHCPADAGPATETSYVAITGPGTAWPGTSKIRYGQVTDGAANTIQVVEVKNSGINWMEPRDLDLATLPTTVNPASGLGISSNHPGIVNVQYADGHAEALNVNISDAELRALLTIAGGDN